ncbi:DUF5816 domain-containing protein [Halorientalis brevis]|uniref:DUF5816 domain-containing protein n=1 Tax=Halorientalis brevis TaxID=1126241 RepID=A0ABD6CF75_9EURY|nr:DUF5816 domain-containing protein [Halorientalis brevis]
MQARTTQDGETLYVDHEAVERGSKGPFYVVYTSSSRDEKWGYFCSNCESFDTAMDAMGRIECNGCRNLRKADEWDAAHE